MFLEGATTFEVIGLWVTFFIAIAGLVYAYLLKRYISRQDDGTPEMQEVSKAIQDGAEAYLRRQLKTVALVIVILAAALFLTAYAGQPENWELSFVPHDAAGNLMYNDTNLNGVLDLDDSYTFDADAASHEWLIVCIGRMLAFLMGAGFSAAVGYFGMRMAVRANVKVAAASRRAVFRAAAVVAEIAVTGLRQLAIEDAARHHRAQDLSGAAADGEHSRIAHHALQRPGARIAGRAEHLERVVGHFDRRFGGKDFRLRGKQGIRKRRRRSRRLVDQFAAGGDLHRHVGKHPLQALEFGNRPAELFARFRVVERELVGAIGEAERDRRRTHTL